MIILLKFVRKLAAFYTNSMCSLKGHAFVVAPMQSTCIHNIVGACAICAANAKIPSAQTIADCSHKWALFTTTLPEKVACDFSLPSHAVDTANAVHHCVYCFAVVCNGCFTG